jgi:hypothetical protein
MSDAGAGWECPLPWDQIQFDKAGDSSHPGQTLTQAQVETEVRRGTKAARLHQFTPLWAAANPADGKRSVPRTSIFRLRVGQ